MATWQINLLENLLTNGWEGTELIELVLCFIAQNNDALLGTGMFPHPLDDIFKECHALVEKTLKDA